MFRNLVFYQIVRKMHDRKLPSVTQHNITTNILIGIDSPKKFDYFKNNKLNEKKNKKKIKK